MQEDLSHCLYSQLPETLHTQFVKELSPLISEVIIADSHILLHL